MRRTLSSPITISAVLLASLGHAQEASAASGGPDAFGYTFVDQADGAVYAYVDISATGIVVGMGDDTLLPANNLGAPFELYGEVLVQMEASTNGWIANLAPTSSDLTNECPMPAAAGGGGGSRIAVLHDDLVTTVYYQYFDEAAAAAIGYPGETEGISVYQWVGDHFPAAAPSDVNAEVILFHDDFSILTMVAGDPEGGSGSSQGIQDATGTVGLTYACNVAGGTAPGMTAVLYTLGGGPPPPDSDCCTASPTGTPGCTDALCEATVCALDPFCCDTAWDGICADEALASCPALCGGPLCGNGIVDPGEDCDGAGQTAACDVDCTFAACGDDTVNAAAGEQCDDGGESVTCDDDCTTASCGDSTVNTTAGETCDDGGRSAACDANCTAASCGDGFVNATAGEECDAGGVSASCDADCTNAMCGDGVVNGPAGEECDGAGESATCDDDCTAASCGDGTVNATAGEACDDGGESAACNADCTAASCGDGVVNGAAGEECDDSGESKACDDDCTAASCGDGAVNATAGEECDDGNTDDGDGCAADCTEEPEPGTTGSEGSSSGGGDDSTGGGETTAADTSGGVDDTGGESGAESSGGPGPVTLSGADSSSGGGDTDTEGPGAEVPDEGCNCTTEPGTGRSGLWSMLGLLGLGALRRRRRA